MKKFWTIFFLILLLVAGLWIFKAPIISNYLSKKMKIGVTIDKIAISKNSATFSKLQILNPKEYKSSVAFSSDEVMIDYVLSEIKAKPTTIDKITLKDNVLNIECNNPICTANNWSKILSLVTEKKSSQEYQIKSLVLENLHVEISGLINGSKSVDIAKMEFNDINSKEGFPTDLLIVEIFKKANLMNYIQDTLKNLKIFDKYFSPFKIFGSNECESVKSI